MNLAAPGPKAGPWLTDAWPAGGTAGTTNGEPPFGVEWGGGAYALGNESWACGYDGARSAVWWPFESGGKASGGKVSGGKVSGGKASVPNGSAPPPDVAPGWWPACWPSDVISASSMTVGRASLCTDAADLAELGVTPVTTPGRPSRGG
ncbi:hypothetical protein AB0J80_25875 [Actinoplanes sp. NPDC049548]|uniref:hypothetical protein n=1 Tax=Actinoplanes sp. NPDC049548 TaxID=3155152 RepID=UPI003422DE76